MNVFSYIIGGLIILFALAIIIAILLQEGRRAGINGAISGGADTFLSKNKARSVDAFLSRWTKYITIAFVVLVLIVNIVAITLK
jgi:preprotein translocase subunit SecG